MEEVKVIVAIDDLHPEKGWGCYGDESVAYLKNLWEEFGCKFTLFIPSNYHGKYPLSEHKDWINYWLKQEWAELAAHGHFHQCERDDIGECEFFELDTEEKTQQRIADCLSEWNKVGVKPKGWRNPGWLAHPNAIKVIGKYLITLPFTNNTIMVSVGIVKLLLVVMVLMKQKILIFIMVFLCFSHT